MLSGEGDEEFHIFGEVFTDQTILREFYWSVKKLLTAPGMPVAMQPR
jgi:hypothetical protein